MVEQLKEIEVLLRKIERTYAFERSQTIGELQDKILDDPGLQSDEFYFLQELAGDLNFYEPFEPDRDTALGYYDDDRLSEITDAAIKKIEDLLTGKTS
jgi:hypothetical protein